MNKRTAAASSLTLVVLFGGGFVAWDVAHPPKTITIESSYAFDVTNPEYLAGNADIIAVVTVLDNGAPFVRPEGVWTDYAVKIDQTLKGEIPATATVRQAGGVDGEETFVIEDQPLLRQGKAYVLVLSREPDRPELTLSAAPLSARPLPPEQARRDAVLTAWRTAILRQKVPPI
ncbi:MAG: hypothetical protein LH624_01950 [Cryobacterium sp.]|nr:hypothetical protein [Cryobacterium sp.]